MRITMPMTMSGFEICGFHKNTKIDISREWNVISSSNKKNW